MYSVPRRETRWTGFRKILKSVTKFGNRLTDLTHVLALLEVELFSEEFIIKLQLKRLCWLSGEASF